MSRIVEMVTLTYSGLQEMCKLANMGFSIEVRTNQQGDDIVFAKDSRGYSRTFLLNVTKEIETDD